MKSLFPSPKKPKETPMPDEEELARARRKKVAEIQNRSGRESTILSDRESFGG